MISLIKTILLKYKISLFRLSFLLFLFIPFLILISFGCLFLLSFAMETRAGLFFSISTIMIVSLICFFSWFILYLIQCRDLRRCPKDYKNNLFESVNCSIILSKPIISSRFLNLPNKILGVNYWSQRASFHKCWFVTEDNEFPQYFYVIQTKEKCEILKKLFETVEKYKKIGIWPQEINFTQKVPVCVVYGKNSRVVKEFLPVMDYGYSDEQLRLIKRLNGDGYWRKGRLQKNKNLERFYTKSLVSFFILFIESIISGIIVLILLYYIILLVINLPENLYILDLLVLYPFLFLLICFITMIAWQFAQNHDECSSILASLGDKSSEIENVIFLSADSFRMNNSSTICFDYLFPDEQLSLMKIHYKNESDNIANIDQDRFVNWIGTNSKIELLQKIYDCGKVMRYSPNRNERPISTEKTFYDDQYKLQVTRIEENAVRRGLKFNNAVPLQIMYAKKSKELKFIAPVEGYDYTETQLAAIEKFNTLYP